MNKIILLSLLLVGLCGCHQADKKQNAIPEKMMADNETTMPSADFDELKDNGIYTKVDDTILLANSEDDPSLRLDFTYQNDQLIQYVSKEYGFVDQMTDHQIDEDDAKLLAERFAKTFLKENMTFQKATPLSGYDNDDYITLVDQFENVYLIQLNKNMVIKYIDHDFN